MALTDGIKQWLFKVALQKALKRAVQLIVAFAVTNASGKAGVTIDPTALTVAIYSGLDVLRNWLKTKYGITWL